MAVINCRRSSRHGNAHLAKPMSVFRLAILFLGRDQGTLMDTFMLLLLSLLPAMLVFVKRETVKTPSACLLHERVVWQMCFRLSTRVNKTPQTPQSVKRFCEFEDFFFQFLFCISITLFPDDTLAKLQYKVFSKCLITLSTLKD